MSVPPVETEVIPPDADEVEDGDDRESSRLCVSWLHVDDVYYDASVQFFGDQPPDPERFAEALIGAALALAAHRGPDYSWAAMRRFSAYGT